MTRYVALIATLIFFFNANASIAMTADQCIQVQPPFALMNMCNAQIMVWFQNCNGTLGIYYASPGRNTYSAGCSSAEQVLYACTVEEYQSGRCRYR